MYPLEVMVGRKGLRIACLIPAATDICVALGLEKQIVGVTHECDPPPPKHEDGDAGVVTLTRDGLDVAAADHDSSPTQHQIHLAVQKSRSSTNSSSASNNTGSKPLYPIVTQAWADAQPNLVITQDLCAVCGPTSADVCTVSKGSSFLPMMVSLSPHTLSDIVDCIESVATACGVDQSQSSRVIQDFKSRIERVRQNVLSVGRRPTALILEWLDPPFDGGHWIPEMLETAGFSPALPKVPGSKSSVLTWEQIDSAAPDIVIVACCGFGLARNLQDAKQHTSFFPKSAQKVYAVDGNRYFARPGPQLSFGVVILAQLAADVTKNSTLVDAITPDDLEQVKRGVAWEIVDETTKNETSSCDMEDLGNALSFDDLHRAACERGEYSYSDPSTGYNVFTEVAHKLRGKCCGSGCRHCPFHHANVKDKVSRIQQPAVLHRGTGCEGSCSQGPLKVLFFSGGKDSFLTLRALLRQNPRPCVVILTTFDATSRMVAHQEVHIRDIQRQAEHLDLTLIGVPLHRASGADYVDRVQKSLSFVESTLGIPVSALVFGDLHLEHIRSWREDRLRPLGYPTEYPLWQENYEVLMRDLLASQVVCVVSASSTEHVQVGAVFDRALYELLEGNDAVDTFGEKGEFHSIAKVWTVDPSVALGLSDQI